MNAQSNPAMTTFAGKLAKTDLKVAKLSTEVTLADLPKLMEAAKEETNAD